MKEKKKRYAGIDIESIGLDPIDGPVIWMISITLDRKTELWEDCNGIKKCPARVKQILQDKDIIKIFHSGQHDVPYIKSVWGVDVKGEVWDSETTETVILGVDFFSTKKKIEDGSTDDTLLRQYGTGLKYALPRYGFPEPDKSEREEFIDRSFGIPFKVRTKNYAKNDTKYLPSLQVKQFNILHEENLSMVAELENGVAPRYYDMKFRGIGFDPNIWRRVSMENIADHKRRIAKLPKGVDNWNSTQQVKKFFHNKHGIEIDTYENIDEIYLLNPNKVLGDFIATRELNSYVSNYGLGWFEKGYIGIDGRIRPHTRQVINTGRNSQSKPNMQKIPGSGNTDPLRLKVLAMVLDEARKKPEHRMAFVPKPGHVFVIGDFSGQEIGVMAAASGEQAWINAMLNGEDVHMLTASLVNRAKWEMGAQKGCIFPKKCSCPMHKAEREPAKITNFMLAYGGGANKFRASMGCDMLYAQQYVSAHKRAIPALIRWLYKQGQEAVATGVTYSADPYRRRRVLNNPIEWRVKNQGMNHPVQAAGANMLKRAMLHLPWSIPIVLTIHDEIICEVPIAAARDTMYTLKEVMEESANFITGIPGLVRVEPKIQMNIMKDLKKVNHISGIKDGRHCVELS